MSSESKTKYDTLLSTTIDTHEEKQCIRLSFKDGEDKFFCLGTLAKKSFQHSAITRSYESLIGKSVSITISDDTEAKTNSSNEGDQSHASSRSWVKYVWVGRDEILESESAQLKKHPLLEAHAKNRERIEMSVFGNRQLQEAIDNKTEWEQLRAKFIAAGLREKYELQDQLAVLIDPNKATRELERRSSGYAPRYTSEEASNVREYIEENKENIKKIEANEAKKKDVLEVCSLCGISDNQLQFYPEEKRWFHRNCKNADLVMLNIVEYGYTEETLPKFLALQTFLFENFSIHALKIVSKRLGGYTVRVLLGDIPVDIYGEIDTFIRDKLRKLSPIGQCELILFTEEHVYSKYLELYPEKDLGAWDLKHFEIDFDEDVFDTHASDSSPDFNDWLDQIFLADFCSWGGFNFPHKTYWIQPDAENDRFSQNYPFK